MDEILDFLKKTRHFFFATVENCEPRVRPLGFFMKYEGRLYIGIGDYKPVCRQLKENPKFELCACDEEAGVWMRIHGTAVCDERPEVNEAVFSQDLFRLGKYTRPDGPRHVPFYIKDGTAVFRDFADNIRSIRF
jgi:uncharacterized pyridoxamine 5'-phosphate oxidase family protein